MARYREVFKELPLPAVLLSAEGEVLDCNNAYADFFGNNELQNLVIDSLLSDVATFKESHLQRDLIERDIPFPENDRRSFRIRLSKIESKIGKLHFIVMFTDISEQRRQIEEIERLALIVDSSDDAIISVSSNMRVMSWNRGAERIYGYKSYNIVESSVMKIVPDSVGEEFSTLVSDVLSGKSFSRHETINCHEDGHLFPVSVTLSPLTFQGAISGVTMISRDISTRRQAEEELTISHRRLKSMMYETVESLSTAHEKRDLYTSGHQRVVSMISCCIADEMNLPHDQIESLRIAGLLHDIGKVCIPMAILSKPSVLSFEEMALIKKHPEAGYEIVKNIPFVWPVSDIILQHHERMDGSGYPRGLMGKDILLGARILAVADVLEAMSAHRPYRPAVGLEAALSEITENSGVKYDQDVCNAALRLFEEGVLRVEQSRLVCSL
jgi:PAS domain S-box-containing protein